MVFIQETDPFFDFYQRLLGHDSIGDRRRKQLLHFFDSLSFIWRWKNKPLFSHGPTVMKRSVAGYSRVIGLKSHIRLPRFTFIAFGFICRVKIFPHSQRNKFFSFNYSLSWSLKPSGERKVLLCGTELCAVNADWIISVEQIFWLKPFFFFHFNHNREFRFLI